MPVQSVFLLNRATDVNVQKRIGVSHIRIGDDPTEYSINNSIIVENITDSGFFEASLLLSGRYLTIRRNQRSPNLSSPYYDAMNLHTLKAYQIPNLVKMYE